MRDSSQTWLAYAEENLACARLVLTHSGCLKFPFPSLFLRLTARRDAANLSSQMVVLSLIFGTKLDPLVSTARYFGTQENFIVTLSQERRIEKDGVIVHSVPAWKWLLEMRD